MSGEVVYRVPSLAAPPEGCDDPLAVCRYDAVSLFLDRARAARPTFALTHANATSVAEICRRLDGMPLALELAGAMVRAVRVDQLAAQLGERICSLAGVSRTAPPRHRTLRATIEGSYQSLTAPERCILLRLAVFSGGWTVAAAEPVCVDDQRPTTNDQHGMSSVGRGSLVRTTP